MAMTAEEKKVRRQNNRINRQIKAYRSIEGEIIRIWDKCLDECWTLEQLVAARVKLMSLPPWKVMDGYQRAKCHGMCDIMFSMINRLLVWTHVHNGVRVLSGEVPADQIRTIDTGDSDHCLRDKQGRLMPWRQENRDKDIAAGRLVL